MRKNDNIERSNRTQMKHLRQMAMNHLIAQKRCSFTRDDEHTLVCYGDDINIQNGSRAWIAELPGYDKIAANKLLLYINLEEYQAELDRLVKESGLVV